MVMLKFIPDKIHSIFPRWGGGGGTKIFTRKIRKRNLQRLILSFAYSAQISQLLHAAISHKTNKASQLHDQD